MDRRRFFTGKSTLTESLSRDESKSLFEDTMSALSRLYEADEQDTAEDKQDTPEDKPEAEDNSAEETNPEAEANSDEESAVGADIQKLAAAADQIEVPDKSVKLSGKADKI